VSEELDAYRELPEAQGYFYIPGMCGPRKATSKCSGHIRASQGYERCATYWSEIFPEGNLYGILPT